MRSEELESEIRKSVRFGKDKRQIKSFLFAKLKDVDQLLIEEAVDRVVDDYPDYDRIQQVMKSYIIVDKDDEEEKYYLYDPRNRELDTIDPGKMSDMLDSKVDLRHKVYTCNFVYDPYNPFVLKKFGKFWKFNNYTPPKWAEDRFYSDGKIKLPKVSECPKLYSKFVSHLVSKDVKSYEYVLDWLANMLQGRNYCILTTIGNQGIGKGVLGEVMRRLVGEENYQKTDRRVISKDFNGQISHKRLIYLDEIKVQNADQENKLKDLINDTIEIEHKGKTAGLEQNFASIYFSSNQMDSIKIPADDRRFSIIELTKTKLIQSMSMKEIDSLLEDENIAEFAYYLMHRPIDTERMMHVFKSTRTELIRSNSLNAWQEWFIDDYCADKSGQKLEQKIVSEDVEEVFGSRTRPGRRAFQNLEEVYPEKFRVFCTNKVNDKGKKVKTWFLEFK